MYRLLLIIITISGLMLAQEFISQRSTLLPENIPSLTENLLSAKFNMKQGFSFMSSMGSGYSASYGLYSNRINYNYNEKLDFHSTVHFVSPRVDMFSNSTQNMNIQYDFGLQYKFSEKSSIFIQFSNSSPRFRQSIEF